MPQGIGLLIPCRPSRPALSRLASGEVTPERGPQSPLLKAFPFHQRRTLCLLPCSQEKCRAFRCCCGSALLCPAPLPQRSLRVVAASLPCLGKCMGRPCADCRCSLTMPVDLYSPAHRRHCRRAGPGGSVPWSKGGSSPRLRTAGEIETDDLGLPGPDRRPLDRGHRSQRSARRLSARASSARVARLPFASAMAEANLVSAVPTFLGQRVGPLAQCLVEIVPGSRPIDIESEFRSPDPVGVELEEWPARSMWAVQGVWMPA